MLVQIFCFGNVLNYRTTFNIELEARKRLFPELNLVDTGGIVTIKKQKSMKQQAAKTTTKSKNSASTVENAKPCFNAPDGLMQKFISFHEKFRDRKYPLEQEELTELGTSICSILLTEAFEPGTGLAASPWRKDNLEVLQKQNYADYPEASGCIYWIKCLENKVEAGLSEDIFKLAKLPLWEPVQRLVYCALAWLGEYRALADLISPEDELNDLDMTLLVLGEYSSSDEAGILERLPAVKDESKKDDDISGYFQKLFNAEVAIAASSAPDSYIEDLKDLSNMTREFPCNNYNDLEKTRIGIRAEAALLRLQLGDTGCSDIVISDKLDKFLPHWEKHYYQGLIHWKKQESDQALAELDCASRHNPGSNAVKYASATIQAESFPEKALDILDGEKLTYESIIARSMVLLRMNKYDDVDAMLSNVGLSELPRVPLRFRWFNAMAGISRQENIIRTALSEYNKDWKAALHFWRKAFVGNTNDNLYLSRRLYISTRLLESLPDDRRREHAQLERDIKRIEYILSGQDLTGDELFFQAAGLMNEPPSTVAGKMNSLRCNRSWFKNEKNAGGERLLLVAKALLQAGNIDDAISIYERSEVNSQRVKNLLAILSVYSGFADGSDDSILAVILDSLHKENSDFGLFNILAALGLLTIGDKSQALNYISLAEKDSSNEKICHILRFLCASGNDKNFLDRNVLESLDVPEDVKMAFRVLSGDHQIETYMKKYGRKWKAFYPVSPVQAIRKKIAVLIQNNDLQEVDKFSSGFGEYGLEVPNDLAIVACLRNILDQLFNKELVSAEKMLTKLEKVL